MTEELIRYFKDKEGKTVNPTREVADWCWIS